MIQVIRRNEGHKSAIETMDNGRPQISYNSDGHLVVRLIHDEGSDTLIVFNQRTTQQIFRFISELVEKDSLPF